MTRRNGIIAALTSVLPILGQTQSTFSQSLTSTTVADPTVTFNPGKDELTIGYDLKTSELFVRTAGKEARVTRQEILEALAKESK